MIPEVIYKNYKKKGLKKEAATKSLITFIETSTNEVQRVQAMNFLGKVSDKSEKILSFLENVAMYDENEEVRFLALKTIMQSISNKTSSILKRSLLHDTLYDYLVNLEDISIFEHYEMKRNPDIEKKTMVDKRNKTIAQIIDNEFIRLTVLSYEFTNRFNIYYKTELDSLVFSSKTTSCPLYICRKNKDPFRHLRMHEIKPISSRKSFKKQFIEKMYYIFNYNTATDKQILIFLLKMNFDLSLKIFREILGEKEKNINLGIPDEKDSQTAFEHPMFKMFSEHEDIVIYLLGR